MLTDFLIIELVTCMKQREPSQNIAYSTHKFTVDPQLLN